MLAVFPLADFLHQLFANGLAFCFMLRHKRFGPFRKGRRSFTPTLLRKASTSWFFCRLSFLSCMAYSPLPLTPCGDRSGLRSFLVSQAILATLPSADFCRPVRMDCSTLSFDFETNGRSPEVSSTAFGAQLPDLQPVPLMDTDFAVMCPLVRHRMPQIRFLYIGSHLCYALLSDFTSR